MFSIVHHYNKEANRTASKNDFSVNGAISDNIDFMIYIGHGLQATDSRGNYLHYNCAPGGSYHTSDCSNPIYNAYNTDMHFGSESSDLRWVWVYSCNFLTPNDYITDDTFKEMMTGAHIVMGYSTQSTLCDAMVEVFASELLKGTTIIDAFFRGGRYGEATVEADNHHQKVMYIPQAYNETIYSPKFDYEYSSDNILIEGRSIHDESDYDMDE